MNIKNSSTNNSIYNDTRNNKNPFEINVKLKYYNYIVKHWEIIKTIYQKEIKTLKRAHDVDDLGNHDVNSK